MRGIWKFTALVGLLAGMLAGPAHGQTLICFKSATGSGCTPVSAAAPLPVTGSISASTTARATAAAPTYVEGSDDPLSVDLSGALRVTVAGGTVTGYAQGSTTSGQLGGLTQAAVTTASPSYTNAQTSPINMNTAGALRVDAVSGSALLTAVQAPIPACSVSPCATVIGGVVLYQGTTANSATNGIYSNLLQGNAVISATNGLFTNQLQGNAVLSATNPSFAATIPTTTGGLTVETFQPTASTNSANIKASAGQVYKIDVFNNSATVHYIRLYNSATTGTCNSATNLIWQGIIPASTSGAGLSSSWDLGIAFSSGIARCVTSGYDGTGNATASALITNIGYK